MKLVVTVLAFAIGMFAVAQDMQMKPPAELAKIEFLLGSWKSSGTFSEEDGSEGKIAGSCVGTKKLGNMWIELKTNDVMGSMGKMEGQLMLTYDPIKSKYVGVWFDSMSTQSMTLAGSFEGTKLVLLSEPVDMGPAGKQEFRITYEAKSAKEVTFALDMKMGDGYMGFMKITYNK